MIAWAQGIMERMGYWGVTLLMFLENVFPPIPSEVVMPFAGFTAARGQMTFWGVVVAGTLGSVLGALPLYYLGKFVGVKRIKGWADRWGKWLTVSGKDVDTAMGWFDRRGGLAVFLCRLVPGVRSLISIPAGACGMTMWKFLLYTTAGSAIWVVLLAYAGTKLGQNYERVEKWMKPVTYAVLAAVVIWIGVTIWRRKHAGATQQSQA
jgi:membrane protein DedA with SNARE-associated domain